MNGTQRRQAILDFIATYYREHRYPPTVREIGEAVGLESTSTVQTHLAILQRDGRITHNPGSPRTILVKV